MKPSREYYSQHRIIDALTAKTAIAPIKLKMKPSERDDLVEVSEVTLSWYDFQVMALKVIE